MTARHLLWIALVLLGPVPVAVDVIWRVDLLSGDLFLMIASACLAVWIGAGVAIFRWLRDRLAKRSLWLRETLLSCWCAFWFMPGALGCGAIAILPMPLLLPILLNSDSGPCNMHQQVLVQVKGMLILVGLILLVRLCWRYWEQRSNRG